MNRLCDAIAAGEVQAAVGASCIGGGQGIAVIFKPV